MATVSCVKVVTVAIIVTDESLWTIFSMFPEGERNKGELLINHNQLHHNLTVKL